MSSVEPHRPVVRVKRLLVLALANRVLCQSEMAIARLFVLRSLRGALLAAVHAPDCVKVESAGPASATRLHDLLGLHVRDLYNHIGVPFLS